MPERLVRNRVFEVLARVGRLVKGVVFGTMGFLAFRTLAGEVAEDADVHGPIAMVSEGVTRRRATSARPWSPWPTPPSCWR